jgi:glucose-6-phosphate isomerase
MRVTLGNTEQISPAILKGHTALLTEYTRTLEWAMQNSAYTTPESVLYTPFDAGMRANVQECAARYRSAKVVCVVGIGGSDLGARAVHDALRGHTEAYAAAPCAPELLFVETVEPEVLDVLRARIAALESAEDMLLIVTSKSGGTLETLTNAQVLYTAFAHRFTKAEAAAQTVVIGDEGSPLHHHAQEHGMQFLAIPHAVGGRFSLFTPAGLFPLAVAGIPIDALCDGAQAALRAVVGSSADKPSVAHMRAAFLLEVCISGIQIHELFLFHPQLETLGKWYRQLLAESLGKEQSDGTKVGLMPTVAIGTTDLHSLGQLIFGGPANRATTFIVAQNAWQHSSVPPHEVANMFGHASMDGHTVGDVPSAVYDALVEQYEQHNLPHMCIALESITPRELGAYMALEMASVMLLGSLLDVNAFDQPAVEAYKEGTRKRLLQTEHRENEGGRG